MSAQNRNPNQGYYAPVQNGKEKRPGLVTMAQWLAWEAYRLLGFTAGDKVKLDGLQIPLSRLAYVAATDVMNGVVLTANTWTDVHANQNFIVTSVNSLSLIELRLSVAFALPATDTSVASRLIFDSTGTPITAKAGGGIGKASTYAHAGGHLFLARGFAAGTHAVKAQVLATTAATAYCRANTTPNTEWAELYIYELTP